ncbi:MAG: hypothetical protein GF317_00630 [Candidatus Lokiarchaeota archaeon]|nr:hypothetical protein [Candidatus Lokiarchaeota archaeon]
MPCKMSQLKEQDTISVWWGKGHLPVRGRVQGFTPKYIKAWVKSGDGNKYIREKGKTINDPPKIFYLTEEQVTKVTPKYKEFLKGFGMDDVSK